MKLENIKEPIEIDISELGIAVADKLFFKVIDGEILARKNNESLDVEIENGMLVLKHKIS